jgi:hypothetical protein
MNTICRLSHNCNRIFVTIIFMIVIITYVVFSIILITSLLYYNCFSFFFVMIYCILANYTLIYS